MKRLKMKFDFTLETIAELTNGKGEEDEQQSSCELYPDQSEQE